MTRKPWENESVAANGFVVRENFYRWFAGSRVVDDFGKPLMVFHGTRFDFAAFRHDMAPTNTWLLGDDNRLGTFFTAHCGRSSDSGPWSGAAGYAGVKQVDGITAAVSGANIMPVYLCIELPLKMCMQEYRRSGDRKDFKEELQALGFDGVFIHDVGTWIAFEPGQIKSAVGNSGLFLKNTGSIDDQETARRLLLAREAANAARQPCRVLEIYP